MLSAVTFHEEYCCPYCGSSKLTILQSEQLVLHLEKGQVEDADIASASKILVCPKCNATFKNYIDNGKNIIPLTVQREYLIKAFKKHITKYNMFTGEEEIVGE